MGPDSIAGSLEVSARLEGSAGLSVGMVARLFEFKNLPLWVVIFLQIFSIFAPLIPFVVQTLPLALAIILRLLSTRYTHPLVFPAYFLAIPVVFYSISYSVGYDVEDLRRLGWVFEVAGVDSEWYEFVTLYGTFPRLPVFESACTGLTDPPCFFRFWPNRLGSHHRHDSHPNCLGWIRARPFCHQRACFGYITRRG